MQRQAPAEGSASLVPGPIAVRLTDYAASQLHIRQLKSSSIGELHGAYCNWRFVQGMRHVLRHTTRLPRT